MMNRSLLLGLTLLLSASIAKPAIQYAGGTNVNFQCTAAAGTKQELSDCIEDEAVAAGWTRISGSHTTSVLLESLSTPTAGLQMRVSLTQGTNTVIIKARNVANTRSHSLGTFLLPGVGKVFRVIANKYQVFIATDGTSAARSAAAFGVLYVPSFTGITEAIWSTGNSISDTDTNSEPSWKYCLVLTNATGCGNSNQLNYWVTINGAQFESISGIGASNIGIPALMVPLPAQTASSGTASYYRWFDNSAFITEAQLAVSTTSTTAEAKVVGQLWDAVVITDSVASETALTFDSRNWLVWTNAGAGNSSTGSARGVLALVVP